MPWPSELFGNTPGIHRLRQALLHVGGYEARIFLFKGETGTGKEL